MDPALLVLVGPTAVGKSALASEVAGRGARGARVEIVAGDAFTVYRGMDVGTAKPGADERTAIAHHLIDVLDPGEEAHVAWFQQAARAAIAEVRSRGHVPLLVGGSGLYVRAVIDDLRFPPTDPDVRAALTDRYADDPPAAHAALAREDPQAAAKIEPGNLRRSVRALEVLELTGQRFSLFATAWQSYRSIYPGLEVRGVDAPAEQLGARIQARARGMVERGLLDEARRLREGELSHTAAQAIGYREAFAVLDGELAVDELAAAIAARTWRYARRQRAWFRRDPRVRWSTSDEVLAAWTGPAPGSGAEVVGG